MSTVVDANVSSKTLIHCFKPLTHSRLLISMPFHRRTHVKSNVVVICSSVSAEVGTTSATSKSAIICMSRFIASCSLAFGHSWRRCSWIMGSWRANCSCFTAVAMSNWKNASLCFYLAVLNVFLIEPRWNRLGIPFLQRNIGNGRFWRCIIKSLVDMRLFVWIILCCSLACRLRPCGLEVTSLMLFLESGCYGSAPSSGTGIDDACWGSN